MSPVIAVNHPPANNDVTLERLEDQIRWYDKKSASCQRWFKWLKAITMISGVFVPVFAVSAKGKNLAALLGIIIVLAEGFQQLNQFQTNWTSYRSTCEALKHEKYLFLAQAGPYEAATRPSAILAERIEGLVSQEHAKWVSARHELEKKAPGK